MVLEAVPFPQMSVKTVERLSTAEVVEYCHGFAAPVKYIWPDGEPGMTGLIVQEMPGTYPPMFHVSVDA